MRKLLAFVLLSMMAAPLCAQSHPILVLGSAAPPFSLPGVDGKIHKLSDYAASPVLAVVFTCNHCPYAKAYEQRIMDLDKKCQSKGYPVIAISPNDPKMVPDDSYDNMVKRSKEKSYSFPYLFDESQQVARKFGAMKTPHVFVLNKSLKGYTVEYIGAIDDNTEDPTQVKQHYVDDAVTALLQGKQVPVSETKAIGCTIKWKK